MIRLITFAVILLILGFSFYRMVRPAAAKEIVPNRKPKPPRPNKRSASMDEFWAQVYDTDSQDDARKIQIRFKDMGVQCLIYTQGKKSVFGESLRNYGVSVPQKDFERAQTILSKLPL